MIKGFFILLTSLMIGSIIVGAIGYHEDRIYDVEEEWDERQIES